MKKLFQKYKANHEANQSSRKGKTALAALGGTGAIAALAPAVGAAPLTFEGLQSPISVEDGLATGFNLLGMFDNWVLLAIGVGLMFLIAGTILWFARQAKAKRSKG